MRLERKYFVALLFAVVLAAVAFYVFAGEQRGRTKETSLEDIDRFNEVLAKVLDHYVDRKELGELIDAAIEGILGQLDPHSVYLDRRQYENLMIDTKGEFGGLGITLTVRDGFPTVISPIEGTPAYRLGIRAGDRIVEIERESTRGWNSEQAVGHLRGAPGTQVNVTIGREVAAGRIDSVYVTITREIIRVPSIAHYDNIDGVGYVRISRFAEDTARDLDAVLGELEGQDIKGVVLDLRSNPGGLLNAAFHVTDLFLEKGKLVVYTESRIPENDQKFFSHGRNVHPDYPVVVLVNGASASASEIVAGALQDWDRGIIVGQPTFGKGSVQTVFRIGNDSALKLTTQKYFTPSGRCIHRDEERDGELAAEDPAGKPAESGEYRTAGGRVVYGDGGITPDWELELPDFTEFQRRLELRGVFFDFAVHFAAGREVGPDFSVTGEVLDEFRRYLEGKEIQHTPDDWSAENTDYVRLGIKREIFRKQFGTRGAYTATLPEDEELGKVLEMFREAPTLPQMFEYVSRKREVARAETP